jgi:hypothetical protein
MIAVCSTTLLLIFMSKITGMHKVVDKGFGMTPPSSISHNEKIEKKVTSKEDCNI